MDNPLLQVNNLNISFATKGEPKPVVKDVSFTINENEFVALVGESGSGKSLTALSLLQLLPPQAKISGEATLPNQTDLYQISGKDLQQIRGNKIAMIFQEPMSSLNPTIKTGEQVMEILVQHKKLSKEKAKLATIDLFKKVRIPDAESAINKYPHQMSGGQKQRVMIAMAISCKPKLLIADEPTTALDASVQKSIMELLLEMKNQYGISILLITHDLALVGKYADKMMVMREGKIVETGSAKTVLGNPQNTYTKALIACKPSPEKKHQRLQVVEDFFVGNQPEKIENRTIANLIDTQEKVLSIKNLVIRYPTSTNFFGKPLTYLTAVNNVSLDVFKNETVGLVGESGCGKTTLGKAILGLTPFHSGSIVLNNKNLSELSNAEKRMTKKDVQIVFQDPYGSLNPRISIGEAIEEPMRVHNRFANKKERREYAQYLLEKVKLDPLLLNRYPHQFSGGQRQRICIARSLALNPSFIVFDESVSALDVSVQAQVLNLINDLKNEYGFTSIFITHDLNVVYYISDRIMVMNEGVIVETGCADDVMFRPKSDYTIKLLSAM